MQDYIRVELRMQDVFTFAANPRTAPATPILIDAAPPLGRSVAATAAELAVAAVDHPLSSSVLLALLKTNVEVAGMSTTVTAQSIRCRDGRKRMTDLLVVIVPDIPASPVALPTLSSGDDYEDILLDRTRSGMQLVVQVVLPVPGDSAPAASNA